MNDYEILLLLDPELPEARQEEILGRTRELIEADGGAVDDHAAWGRRRLAFEIDKKAEGAYHLLTFRCEPAALDEVTRVLKITDGVMRHMATRRPRGQRRPATPPPPPPAAAPQEEYAEPAAGETDAGTPEGEE